MDGQKPAASVVARPAQLDPPTLVRVRWVVVGEVNQPALFVPYILPVHDHGLAGSDWYAPSDAHVVVDQQRLGRGTHLHDEALVRTRRAGVIGEEPRDASFRGDF